uniref:Uncharacterized protein n=1 Tax=viral metagenome TaxID=1070528 RepID=A0A2V0RIJ9_9ZZZZ
MDNLNLKANKFNTFFYQDVALLNRYCIEKSAMLRLLSKKHTRKSFNVFTNDDFSCELYVGQDGLINAIDTMIKFDCQEYPDEANNLVLIERLDKLIHWLHKELDEAANAHDHANYIDECFDCLGLIAMIIKEYGLGVMTFYGSMLSRCAHVLTPMIEVFSTINENTETDVMNNNTCYTLKGKPTFTSTKDILYLLSFKELWDDKQMRRNREIIPMRFIEQAMHLVCHKAVHHSLNN